MKLELTFKNNEDFERRFNDESIGECEHQSNCYNYFPNNIGYCMRDRSDTSKCFCTREQEFDRRYNDKNRGHCCFEKKCYNYDPNIVGACMSGFEDVLECFVDKKDMKEENPNANSE
jgi:hypothetical protein